MDDALQRIINKLELNENMVSTIIGGVVLLIVAFLFLNYFSEYRPTLNPNSVTPASQTSEPTTGTIGETSSAATSRYVVKEAETLWSIAEEEYGDGHYWVQIAEANNLANPNLLEAGEELDLPRFADMDSLDQNSGQTIDPQTTQSPDTYQVQKGDTLWQIAQTTYNDGYRWGDIWRANQERVPNPNILPTGIELSLPN